MTEFARFIIYGSLLVAGCEWSKHRSVPPDFAAVSAAESSAPVAEVSEPETSRFEIRRVPILDAPQRFGGTVSDELLDHLETRIRALGWSADEVWFVYVRGTSRRSVTKYYVEVYRHPDRHDGRLHHGEFIRLRTIEDEEFIAALSRRVDRLDELPHMPQPYCWVRPARQLPLVRPHFVDLSLLPFVPPDGFSNEQIVAMVDLLRSAPENSLPPGHIPGAGQDRVRADSPIWRVGGSPEEPMVWLLERDRRRKSGQLVRLRWESESYWVVGIGRYGASTGFPVMW